MLGRRGCLLDLVDFLGVPLGVLGARWVNLGRVGGVMLLKHHACAQNPGSWNSLLDHGNHHEMVS